MLKLKLKGHRHTVSKFGMKLEVLSCHWISQPVILPLYKDNCVRFPKLIYFFNKNLQELLHKWTKTWMCLWC